MSVGLTAVDVMDETTELFRPVGQEELNLIREGGFVAFPPRLPEQPIFYPVLNAEYAIQIARDWNTTQPLKMWIRYSISHSQFVSSTLPDSHRRRLSASGILDPRRGPERIQPEHRRED